MWVVAVLLAFRSYNNLGDLGRLRHIGLFVVSATLPALSQTRAPLPPAVDRRRWSLRPGAVSARTAGDQPGCCGGRGDPHLQDHVQDKGTDETTHADPYVIDERHRRWPWSRR
ncbi:hypothetical protein CD944_04420 [Brevundimonas diminuta]|nr:hypothetical protein BDIM_13920 [Brevundimonas diminuta ATCC 11568]OMG60598.1 hypothetical protein BJP32_00755 [Brevundimonas sp. ZS04]OWR21674.1 hypothetical protein CD944_04420 [Brevundimonas diminuta]